METYQLLWIEFLVFNFKVKSLILKIKSIIEINSVYLYKMPIHIHFFQRHFLTNLYTLKCSLVSLKIRTHSALHIFHFNTRNKIHCCSMVEDILSKQSSDETLTLQQSPLFSEHVKMGL